MTSISIGDKFSVCPMPLAMSRKHDRPIEELGQLSRPEMASKEVIQHKATCSVACRLPASSS